MIAGIKESQQIEISRCTGGDEVEGKEKQGMRRGRMCNLKEKKVLGRKTDDRMKETKLILKTKQEIQRWTTQKINKYLEEKQEDDSNKETNKK